MLSSNVFGSGDFLLLRQPRISLHYKLVKSEFHSGGTAAGCGETGMRPPVAVVSARRLRGGGCSGLGGRWYAAAELRATYGLSTESFNVRVKFPPPRSWAGRGGGGNGWSPVSAPWIWVAGSGVGA